MTALISVYIFIICASWAHSSELCGLEPPKEGESKCDGESPLMGDTDELDKKWDRELYPKASYTSEEEWPYRERLDDADDYIVHEPEKAITLFNQILTEVQSNRAIYARARTKEINYLTKEDTQMFDEILGDFIQVMRDEKALKTIWSSAFYHIQTLFENRIETFYKKQSEFLQYILFSRMEDAKSSLSVDNVMSNLLEIYYAQGEFSQGAEIFEKARNLTEFTSPYLDFLHGAMLRQIPERKREGNKILRGIVPESLTSSMATVIEIFIDKCRKLGHLKEEQILSIVKEASKLHVIAGMDQKPLEFVPDIKNQPLWDLEEDKEITVHEEEIMSLIENVDAIRKEAEVLAKDIKGEGWTSLPSSVIKVTGNWSEYPLFSFGAKRHHYCSKAEETCKLFKSFPSSSKFKRGTVKFIHLQPNSGVRALHGPSNAVLRCHLGLSVPSSGEVDFSVGSRSGISLEKGKVVIFDNSYDRSLFNRSPNEHLLLLSFDLPNPDLDMNTKDVSYSDNAKPYFIF